MMTSMITRGGGGGGPFCRIATITMATTSLQVLPTLNRPLLAYYYYSVTTGKSVFFPLPQIKGTSYHLHHRRRALSSSSSDTPNLNLNPNPNPNPNPKPSTQRPSPSTKASVWVPPPAIAEATTLEDLVEAVVLLRQHTSIPFDGRLLTSIYQRLVSIVLTEKPLLPTTTAVSEGSVTPPQQGEGKGEGSVSLSSTNPAVATKQRLERSKRRWLRALEEIRTCWIPSELHPNADVELTMDQILFFLEVHHQCEDFHLDLHRFLTRKCSSLGPGELNLDQLCQLLAYCQKCLTELKVTFQRSLSTRVGALFGTHLAYLMMNRMGTGYLVHLILNICLAYYTSGGQVSSSSVITGNMANLKANPNASITGSVGKLTPTQLLTVFHLLLYFIPKHRKKTIVRYLYMDVITTDPEALGVRGAVQLVCCVASAQGYLPRELNMVDHRNPHMIQQLRQKGGVKFKLASVDVEAYLTAVAEWILQKDSKLKQIGVKELVETFEAMAVMWQSQYDALKRFSVSVSGKKFLAAILARAKFLPVELYSERDIARILASFVSLQIYDDHLINSLQNRCVSLCHVFTPVELRGTGLFAAYSSNFDPLTAKSILASSQALYAYTPAFRQLFSKFAQFVDSVDFFIAVFLFATLTLMLYPEVLEDDLLDDGTPAAAPTQTTKI